MEDVSMEINREKIHLCAKSVEHLYDLIKTTEEVDDTKINELMTLAINMAAYHFNEVEISKIKDIVTTNCQIKQYDGISITNDYNHYNWYSERIKSDSDADEFFWDRYRNYLLEEQHLSLNVVNKLGQDTLTDLMNYLGDPGSADQFLRRGLIIGDVQSGKTSTYIGLICKAADAGYKVVILLTGTIETLRNQTQKRVEEGFVGINISQCENGTQAVRVGVGKDNLPIKVTAMTSRDYDFVGNVNRITTSLENHKVVLCIMKKNSTVLTKLIDWLVSQNADQHDNRIHYPMLLIDDEADNASINTNKPEENPTTINSLIRKLADSFVQTTYVGFTATPFANVFINPETTEDMINHDLFPENFIYCLPSPSNYIGSKEIFGKDGRYTHSLVFIKDAGVVEKDGFSFYYKHTKDWNDNLPQSLTDAIYAFFIANAIRDLRRDNDEPRTMMINISRFINVQHCVKQKVEQIFERAYSTVKYDLGNNHQKNMKNPELHRMYNIWGKVYKESEFSWDEIKRVLFKAIENIQIKVVNSSKNSEKLDYEHNKNLRVIAIGGLALSRGLTLEGLLVSYFYRNTSTYDVLMQMGRWFGYRKNYEDIFRIWTSRKSAEWYNEISYATELLKDDISIMRELKKTPKEFGIRVRNDSQELRITAPNKMRLAADKIEQSSYFGDIVETPYLILDIKTNRNNLTAVENLVESSADAGIEFKQLPNRGAHYALRDVPKNLITNLIRSYKSSRFNPHFDTDQIYHFLITCSDPILKKWDVIFMEGSKQGEQHLIAGKGIFPIQRGFSVDEYEKRINIGSRGKLAGPQDGMQCIDNQDEIEAAKSLFRGEYEKIKEVPWTTQKSYPSNTWFKYIKKRNPLLIIYLIKLDDNNDPQKKKFITEYGASPLVGLAMGIPNVNGAVKEIHKYKVNPIYTQTEINEMFLESEEE